MSGTILSWIRMNRLDLDSFLTDNTVPQQGILAVIVSLGLGVCMSCKLAGSELMMEFGRMPFWNLIWNIYFSLE